METRLHSFLGIFCHFQNCKAKVCRTNGSKVINNYWLDSLGAPVWSFWCFFLSLSLFLVVNNHIKRVTVTIKVTISVIFFFKFQSIQNDVKLCSSQNSKYIKHFQSQTFKKDLSYTHFRSKVKISEKRETKFARFFLKIEFFRSKIFSCNSK